MTVRQRRLLMMLVLAGTLGVSAIAASSASAVLKRLPNGQVVSYQPLLKAAPAPTPFDQVFTNMDYNGGPVMPSNTDYMFLWSPRGLSAYPQGFVSGISRHAGRSGCHIWRSAARAAAASRSAGWPLGRT